MKLSEFQEEAAVEFFLNVYDECLAPAEPDLASRMQNHTLAAVLLGAWRQLLESDTERWRKISGPEIGDVSLRSWIASVVNKVECDCQPVSKDTPTASGQYWVSRPGSRVKACVVFVFIDADNPNSSAWVLMPDGSKLPLASADFQKARWCGPLIDPFEPV